MGRLGRYRTWFLAAAIYNALWGVVVLIWPNLLLRLVGMSPLNYPPIMQSVGMMVGVYAIGYWLIAQDPVRYGPFVYIGVLGKLFGPVGLIWAAVHGDLPWSFGWINVTNDIIWLPAFIGFALAYQKDPEVRSILLSEAESAPLAWNPITGGKRAWVCFEDDKTFDLGPDPSGERFQEITGRILSGNYYPPDAVQFWGRFTEENRTLQKGDRILQAAPLFCKRGGPLMYSSAEIYVADLTSSTCKIGYVTTKLHFGRGIWTAELTRKDNQLNLRVWSTASPNRFLFWLGLPYARYLQLRARSRAVQEFRKI